MKKIRIFITGMGLVSSTADNIKDTVLSIKENKRGIAPVTLFTPSYDPLPVGEVKENITDDDIPRSHYLAMKAAKEALVDGSIPDAIVVGTTTGGMDVTEEMLKKGVKDPELFKYHSTGSIAEYLAEEFGCKGPVFTISTACSSGTVGMKVAVELLRHGKAKRVLVGGADSLCRLTYYGFNSLKLIDPGGAKPFDKDRLGMSVAEGAAMLLLCADEDVPEGAVAEVLGAGLSCDAHHPAAPHPEGEGAFNAMVEALKDSGLSKDDIDYINLHGTGTKENDSSEAQAVKSLFTDNVPAHSSVKGATGHSLAAAGAIEAVLSTLAITEGVVPANTGCSHPDPELDVNPVIEPLEKDVKAVMSNSFGFGGNNASVIIGDYNKFKNPVSIKEQCKFTVCGASCVTGAGDTDASFARMMSGDTCKGMLPVEEISKDLPQRSVRRLKRMPKMVLSLAVSAYESSDLGVPPSSIYLGTGWGALSETYAFLNKLYETNEEFTSPTDFIGSVHNAPAGQVAIWYKSKGPNITNTGGNYSFEQSLMTAGLIDHNKDESIFIIGADESHKELTPLFEKAFPFDDCHSDGGGALCLKKRDSDEGTAISCVFFENANNNNDVINSLINSIGGAESIKEYGALFVGMPADLKDVCEAQFEEFLSASGFSGPVIDYRKYTGEFASASATAAVLAYKFIQHDEISSEITGDGPAQLKDRGILMIGLGEFVTCVDIS